MAFIKGDKALTKENVLKKVQSYWIFKKYCSRFEQIEKMFKSEFRKEQKPSCHIVMWKGDLLYKDFGEKDGYRAIDYVARKFNTDFNGALRIINRDFNLGLGTSQDSSGASPQIVENTIVDLQSYERKIPTVIEIKPRRWTKKDREYWSKYSIPLRLLKYHNIKSISHYRVTSENRGTYSSSLNPYMIGYSSGIPVSGKFRKGDYYLNYDQTSGQPFGWVCTTGGTPGTWKIISTVS